MSERGVNTYQEKDVERAKIRQVHQLNAIWDNRPKWSDARKFNLLFKNLTCCFLKAEQVLARIPVPLDRQIQSFPKDLGWGHFTSILKLHSFTVLTSSDAFKSEEELVHIYADPILPMSDVQMLLWPTWKDPGENLDQKNNFLITNVQTVVLGKEMSCFGTYRRCGNIRGRISGKRYSAISLCSNHLASFLCPACAVAMLELTS